MIIDAIVLTGGRSARLDSAPKSELFFGAETLLQRTLSAVRIARRTVIVGPVPSGSTPEGVLQTRESPLFGGPAAGIAAGMASLAAHPGGPSDAVLVYACDMPHVDRATPLLLAGLLSHPNAGGVVSTDADGRHQPLAAAYRTAKLVTAIAAHQRSGLTGLSATRLVDSLELAVIHMPNGTTADVDTWHDARRLGVSTAPSAHAPSSQGGHHE